MAITDGYLIITDLGGTREYDTKSCPHCGGFFVVVPGSGRVRGFCQSCDAPLCDNPRCLEITRWYRRHTPFKKRLDLVEAGKLPLEKL